MKRNIILLIFTVLAIGSLSAQYQMQVHSSDSVAYESSIDEIESVVVNDSKSYFNVYQGDPFVLPLEKIDSITFFYNPIVVEVGEELIVDYKGDSVVITNPYDKQGVNVTAEGCNVEVKANGIADLKIILTGSSSSGSFTISNTQNQTITLNNLSLQANTTPALHIKKEIQTSLIVEGENSLSDSSTNEKNSVISGSGILLIEGDGNLNIEANKKHAVSMDIAINVALDGEMTISNSQIAGKGLKSDGKIEVLKGNLSISTTGNGVVETVSGVTDSSTACCIKSSGHISLLGGNITCNSTGTGGKGIAADSTLVIGVVGADNNNLILNVTTSGERFFVSGSGMNADYANPKAIKSEGDMTVNSGTITVRCNQTNEGGEGLESKNILTINGGLLDIETYDDCINAANHIEIAGGTVYCKANGNDGIDSNGTLTLSGGFVITSGTKSPEEGFDCDNNRFAITGGTHIGTGGSTSNPTTSACTQYVIKYSNATPGSSICIKNSAGDIILMYQLPEYSTSSGGTNPGGGGPGGGGPGGGGGNSMLVLFSDPALAKGSYTLQYGGTITEGTTVKGYNTGGTYTGGSSKTFTISNIITSI